MLRGTAGNRVILHNISYFCLQFQKSNLNNPSSIAFDWIHRTLYWVDSTEATINLIQITSRLEATVVSPQSMESQAGLNVRHISPKSITIDPTIR